MSRVAGLNQLRAIYDTIKEPEGAEGQGQSGRGCFAVREESPYVRSYSRTTR